MTPEYKRLEYGAWLVPCPLHAAQYKDFRNGVQRISGLLLVVFYDHICEGICAVYLEL